MTAVSVGPVRRWFSASRPVLMGWGASDVPSAVEKDPAAVFLDAVVIDFTCTSWLRTRYHR